MKKWSRIGPIQETQMLGLLETGGLDTQTLVWHPSLTQWLPLSATPLANSIQHPLAPPPLPAAVINNTIVWILAFAPIIGIFVKVLSQVLFITVDTACYAGCVRR